MKNTFKKTFPILLIIISIVINVLLKEHKIVVLILGIVGLLICLAMTTISNKLILKNKNDIDDEDLKLMQNEIGSCFKFVPLILSIAISIILFVI